MKRLRLWLVVALFALAASATSLGNGFAYDDEAIILHNPKVHALRAPWEPFRESYWTGDKCCALYRPFVILGYTLEWRASGGTPRLFHVVNIVLIAVASILVFELATLLLPELWALLAAAAFAVHPVHVEAVANVVGQAELWMTVAVLAAVLIYVRARRQAAPSASLRLALFVAAAVAAFSKEQGVTLTALLLFAELFIVRGRETNDASNAGARPLLTIGVLGGLTSLAVRIVAVRGLGQGMPAAGLNGLSGVERMRVAIGTIPTWSRLMLWPAQLSAEYAPPAYGPALGSGATLFAGVAIAVIVVALIVWSWRRVPAVAFGLLWFIAAVSPVSNFLFPTGIVVAERTLMLPSVGVMIAVAGALASVWATLRSRGLQVALAAALAVVLALGVARSNSRNHVWHDSTTLFTQMPLDSPRSYRAFKMNSLARAARGDSVGQVAALDHAIALWGHDAELFEDRGQLARVRQGCRAGIPFFAQALVADSSAPRARSRLFACLLEIGDIDAARRVAAADPEGDLPSYRRMLAKADSAKRAAL